MQTQALGHQRAVKGLIAFTAGRLAEENVAMRYQRDGYQLLASRWRSQFGEIDLIFRQGALLVFVEVKSARCHDAAAARLSRRQMDRICNAACDYVAGLTQGLMAEMRFDAALVDSLGMIQILENAFGEN